MKDPRRSGGLSAGSARSADPYEIMMVVLRMTVMWSQEYGVKGCGESNGCLE